MKTTLSLIAILLFFTACEKCEYCTTVRSVTYSGDTIAPPQITEYRREECGPKTEATKTMVRIETANNITKKITETTSCTSY
jgi:hypothetical protein